MAAPGLLVGPAAVVERAALALSLRAPARAATAAALAAVKAAKAATALDGTVSAATVETVASA
jgi:hypothetical protein